MHHNFFSPAVLIGLLVLSAFFSAAEAALISVNKVRVRHLMEQKKRGAARVYRVISRMDKLIATILVCNTLVNTAIASISTLILTDIFGEQNGLLIATFAITGILVVFGELTPKILATNHPEGVAFLFRHLISVLIFIFQPVTNLLTMISNGFIRLLGGNPHHRSPLVTEEEIKMMIAIGKEEGFYGDSERRMLERIFHFDEIEVRDVMTPLEKITAVPLDIEENELERVLLEEGHNRVPVYSGSKDNIMGILYVRDLLYLFREGQLIRLNDLVSAPYFVPSNKKATELLKEFQTNKIQIAIVRDVKTVRTVGLVTLEDLLEEIVGEIEEDTKVKK
jgi:putative hemolysin